MVGVHPRNIHTKSESNLSISLREEVKNDISNSDIYCKYACFVNYPEAH